ncbi:MAG: hypothetical protein RL095_2504 [Verrucomicrobiota bacterium]|jgi:serpin B
MLPPIRSALAFVFLFSLQLAAGVPESAREKPLPLTSEIDFSFKLLAATQPDHDGNLCVSPWSAAKALAMAGSGAKGASATEFAQVLSLEPENSSEACLLYLRRTQALQKQWQAAANPAGDKIAQVRQALLPLEAELKKLGFENERRQQQLVSRINALRTQLPCFEISSAEGLFADRSLPIEAKLLEGFRQQGVQISRQCDFRGDPEASRSQINAWGAAATRQLIPEVLPAPLPPETRLCLAQAVYFKGEWNLPFKKDLTQEAPFLLPGGKTNLKCQMMCQQDSFPYLALDAKGVPVASPATIPLGADPAKFFPAHGFHFLELPYKGHRLSLVLITARDVDDIDKLTPLLTAQNFQRWSRTAKNRECLVHLPRFKIAGPSRNLTGELQSLGLKQVFTDKAELGGFSTAPLKLDSVWQQCFIAVDEVGTEAAAVTVALAAPAGIEESVPLIPEFRADRPFWYFLRDRQSGAILFCGRLSKPQ